MKPTPDVRNPSRNTARFLLLGALAWLCALVPAFAQGTGTVTGTVFDKTTNTYLIGAEIRVAGSGLSTAAGRDGSFTLSGVPAGAQTLEISYLGRKTKQIPVNVASDGTARVTVDLSESDVIVMQAVTVESVREGQSRAINQQRTSNTVVNIISADAIGNLPDQTVGDALARMAGVSIVLEGSSAFASIRGSEAKFNSVTLDGAHIGSPANDNISSVAGTENRSVDLSTIPSDMISSIEVFKALTPDRDADAFGGQVNLVTRSAFDLPGRSINGRAEYRINNLRKDDGYAFSLNYSDVVNAARTLGVTGTLTYADEKFDRTDYEIAYFDKAIAPVNTIAGITNQAISDFDQRYRRRERENLGAGVNFDFRPGTTSQYYLKLFHNGSEETVSRWRFVPRGFAAFAANSTDVRASGAEARLRRRMDRVDNERDNDRITIGGRTTLPDGTLHYEAGYDRGTFEGKSRRYQFETASAALRRNIDWTIDRSNPAFPVVTMTNRPTGENSLFRTQDMALNQLRYLTVDSEDENRHAKLDYDFDRNLGSLPIRWKVGAKYRGKDRMLDGTLDDYAPVGAAQLQSSFATGNFEPRASFDGPTAVFGPYPDIDTVFATFTQNRAAWNPANADESAVVALSRYSAGEDIVSGYGMGTAQFGRLQVVGGLRYEHTKFDYSYRPTPATRATGGSSYDDIFPSVLLTLRVTRDLVVRGAWTNTLSRPDYGDMIPYESSADPEAAANLDNPGALVSVFRGNPNLKAQRAMNFDTTVEWYFQPTGMLSVALFQKNISDFIYKSLTRENRGPVTFALYQNRNGADQLLRGLELTWTQALTMLPSPLDGFGFSVNATFIRGESDFPTVNIATGATGIRTEGFIPLQPKRVYNAQAYWEKYGFTARVALNYTDEFVRDYGGLSGSVTNNDATRVDAQVSYRINQNFTVFAEGKNLTQETLRWYATTPNRPEELQYNGWNGAAGVRFRF